MTTIHRADINHVLMQMRQVRQAIQPQNERNPLLDSVDRVQKNDIPTSPVNSNPNFPNVTPDVTAPDFETMFKNAINTVNRHQMQAGELQQRFEMGDPRVDLPEVMIAAQKSAVSFQAMTQVRNKLISAYEDIMNMPI